MIWKTILIPFYLMWLAAPMDHGIGTCVDHGIYITVIEINHNLEAGQVVIKSFSDDLQNALRGMNAAIAQNANPCEEIDVLNNYINQHVSIKINGVVLDLEIGDCRIESDTHWIYLDYQTEGNLNTVNVETDWMIELFANQQNIIKVKSGDQRMNDRLSGERTACQLTIDNHYCPIKIENVEKFGCSLYKMVYSL